VDDYLSEQEQWERVRGWLAQNGPWVIAGVAVAAAGLWGYRFWQGRVEGQLLQAAAQYEQVIGAFGKNDMASVTSLADKLAADHPGSGYAEQAQLAAARLQVENNQLPAALARLQAVLASTPDAELALTVRLRIARIQLEQNQPDQALATLAAATPGAFAPRYAEVRGDALLAKGDREGALRAYREAQANGAAAAGDLLALKINELTRS
jgi:predicted negative regulator of RcsB-dependent stress response